MMKDANELLLGGGGGKAASFPRIGTIVAGEVLSEPKTQEVTDMVTKDVKRFKNGDPMMQVLITIQTELRDPDDPEDDGVRTVYAKNKMLKAIGQAMRTAKVKAIEPGGFLEIGYIGDGPKGDMPIPPKLFEARYTPPAPQASSVFMQAAGAEPAIPARSVLNSAPPAQQPVQRTTLDQLRATSFSAQGQPQANEAPF
jgi:hypothetical protein